MATIAIIENGPLTGRFFVPYVEAAGHSCRLFRAWRGESLSPAGSTALILTGDIHNVTDGLKGYHERVLELLERSGGLRVYASCFSHQLVALWQGGTVERRRERLLGWERLELTGTHGALAGMDSLSALCMNIDEVTEVPPGAALVASSPGCACQALSYGDRMLTCQAHPEMNPHRNGAAASAAALLLCRGRPAVYRSFRRGRPDASDASSDEFMKRVAGWLAGSADPLSTGDGR